MPINKGCFIQEPSKIKKMVGMNFLSLTSTHHFSLTPHPTTLPLHQYQSLPLINLHTHITPAVSPSTCHDLFLCNYTLHLYSTSVFATTTFPLSSTYKLLPVIRKPL